MPPRPVLAALLVAQKLASAREVERAGKTRGDAPLWRKLLDAELLTADQLFALLRDHSKIPVVTDKALTTMPPPEMLRRLVSREDALRLGLLPLELSTDGRRVQMAMIDPTDEASLRGLARNSGFESAKVFLIAGTSFEAVVDRAYSGRVAREPAGRSTVEPAAKVGHRTELESTERLEQVMVQASLGLGFVLEVELMRGEPRRATSARTAARLAREVARELGHDRRKVAIAGLAAMLVRLDAVRRAQRGDEEPTLFDTIAAEVGWAGGGEDGLLGIGRALTAHSAGFGRPQAGGSLQRVVQVVADFLALGGVDGEPLGLDGPGLEQLGQLLRASSAGAQVVEALLQVLRRERDERTPAIATTLPEGGTQPSAITNVRRSVAETIPELIEEDDRDERTQLVSLPTRMD